MPVSYLGQHDDNQRILNQLTQIESNVLVIGESINNLGNNGVSISSTLATATLNLSNPDRDLIYLLGAGSSGFVNPAPGLITLSGSSAIDGIPWNRNTVDPFTVGGAVNAYLEIDFLPTRTCAINGLGWLPRADNSYYPNVLLIQGADDGSSWTTIYTWTTGGFLGQWKYQTFSNNTGYRYIRFQLSGTDSNGSYYVSGLELRIYGSVTNP